MLHIPSSSVAISRIGFGCARIFGGRELRSSARLIEAAIGCGITHFDTAPSYGSEGVLGAVLGDLRDVTIATKVGLPGPNKQRATKIRVFGSLYRATLRPLLGRVPAVKSRLLRIAARPVEINASVVKRELHRDEVLRVLEASLRHLRRPKLDLYMLHEPEGIEITDELCELFLALQRDGIIGAFGVAFGGPPTTVRSFGTVQQCRFPGRAQILLPREKINIYHGVVRFGFQSRIRKHAQLSARTLIAEALKTNPSSAVIFSASSERQIRQIAHADAVYGQRPA